MVCHSLPWGTTFYQVLTGRDVPLRHSPRRDDMPGAPVVPRLVLVEPVNLHRLPGLNLGAAWARTKPCWSRRERGVPGRLELGSEDAPLWSFQLPQAPSFQASLQPLAALGPFCTRTAYRWPSPGPLLSSLLAPRRFGPGPPAQTTPRSQLKARRKIV